MEPLMTLSVNGTSSLTSNQSPDTAGLKKWIVTEVHAVQSSPKYAEPKQFPRLEEKYNSAEISYICGMITDTNTLDKYNISREKLEQIHDGCRRAELNKNNNRKEANIQIDTPMKVILNEINILEEPRYSKEEISLDDLQQNPSENTVENVETERKTCKMVVKSKHLIFNYDETKGYYLCFPLAKLIWFTLSLPFFGFIFCVVWSILYNFEETTFTHCKVWNFLPSISAAIGNHLTQYVVWVTAITVHAGPRFLFISIYYRYYLKMVKHQKQYLAKVACSLNVIENISLLGLTYLSSAGSYAIHEKCFITFMASSELYMLLTCIIFRYHRKSSTMDKYEIFSLRMKTRLLIVNAISFSTAGYFFLRHNKYCEPGIYTLFAFFEYIVVLSNMAFHLTALLDFKDQCITVYKKGIDVR